MISTRLLLSSTTSSFLALSNASNHSRRAFCNRTRNSKILSTTSSVWHVRDKQLSSVAAARVSSSISTSPSSLCRKRTAVYSYRAFSHQADQGNSNNNNSNNSTSSDKSKITSTSDPKNDKSIVDRKPEEPEVGGTTEPTLIEPGSLTATSRGGGRAPVAFPWREVQPHSWFSSSLIELAIEWISRSKFIGILGSGSEDYFKDPWRATTYFDHDIPLGSSQAFRQVTAAIFRQPQEVIDETPEDDKEEAKEVPEKENEGTQDTDVEGTGAGVTGAKTEAAAAAAAAANAGDATGLEKETTAGEAGKEHKEGQAKEKRVDTKKSAAPRHVKFIDPREVMEEALAEFYITANTVSACSSMRVYYKLEDVLEANVSRVYLMTSVKEATAAKGSRAIEEEEEEDEKRFHPAELLKAQAERIGGLFRVLVDIKTREVFYVADDKTNEIVQGSDAVMNRYHRLTLEVLVRDKHQDPLDWKVVDLDNWVGRSHWAKYVTK